MNTRRAGVILMGIFSIAMAFPLSVITEEAPVAKTYYIKGEALWGWPAARPKITEMQETEAKADLKKIK